MDVVHATTGFTDVLPRVTDDMVSRPGSAVSLLRTVVGLYLREAGGWMPTDAFLALLGALGVPVPQARTALSRVKQRGLLEAEAQDGVPGLALAPGAVAMLARGDRRIHEPRSMAADGEWCLIVFSIPEAMRDARHQLRRQLKWIGCGTVESGVWICPDFLRGEVEDVIGGLGLSGHVVLFTARGLPAGPVAAGQVGHWWDLEAIAELHREFIDGQSRVPERSAGPAESFAAYVECIDAWRVIPYLDPGLPPELLPQDWPGPECIALFRRIREVHAGPAWEFVRRVLAA
ncbi:PaaX family transcriptional regulator C-terminal domain-containing protein [Sinomonas sp. ASV486]|uniref:PaaX family transcriptional regulator n=1 Tax=Sinomonas sp. ASV486 TaxID=3051170 RepID=UPI0027DCDACA|nr:PaaX family transcriptional regulator C-terminal domain-containing protein [Sinomonas sp. ASV486]MDQ4491292.1 PaaX family transcriptional regulator C-terminal domain-containing protein [Sinomonas sp. ASV486]